MVKLEKTRLKHLKFTVTVVTCVPAGLEDVFDDLKIEVNEGEMVHEFDNVVVGNDVMLNRKRPKVKKNYILLHQNLTIG